MSGAPPEVWNPPNDALKMYPLDSKLKALVTAVEKRKFYRVDADLCIFVAPDYLFYDQRAPYDEAALEKYAATVNELCSGIEDDFLVIAGSMQWTNTEQKTLSVTSFVTSPSTSSCVGGGNASACSLLEAHVGPSGPASWKDAAWGSTPRQLRWPLRRGQLSRPRGAQGIVDLRCTTCSQE